MLLEGTLQTMQTTMYTAAMAFQTIATDSCMDVREQRTEPISQLHECPRTKEKDVDDASDEDYLVRPTSEQRCTACSSRNIA